MIYSVKDGVGALSAGRMRHDGGVAAMPSFSKIMSTPDRDVTPVTGVFYPGPTAHGSVRGHHERDRRCGIVLSRIWVGRYADALFAGNGVPLILLKHCIYQQNKSWLCVSSLILYISQRLGVKG